MKGGVPYPCRHKNEEKNGKTDLPKDKKGVHYPLGAKTERLRIDYNLPL